MVQAMTIDRQSDNYTTVYPQAWLFGCPRPAAPRRLERECAQGRCRRHPVCAGTGVRAFGRRTQELTPSSPDGPEQKISIRSRITGLFVLFTELRSYVA